MGSSETPGRGDVTGSAPQDINRIFVEDGHLIDEALARGVRAAMARHKAAGLPVVIYRDGKTVWVTPEELGF
jgi:hypothetical protein